MLLRYHDPADWSMSREANAGLNEAGVGNAPAASRNGGKAGNGKPVGS